MPVRREPPSDLSDWGGRALIATACWSGNGGASHKYHTGAEEFAGFRELGGDALGMEDGCVLVGMVASNAIGRKTVFVDNVEEESHPDRLSRTTAGFQVTKL